MSNKRAPSAELSWGDLADIEQAWTAVLDEAVRDDADLDDEDASYVLKLCHTIRELCIDRDQRDAQFENGYERGYDDGLHKRPKWGNGSD